MAEENNQEEVSVETAVGKFRARGSDILAVFTLIVCICGFTIGGFLWKNHDENSQRGNVALAGAIDKLTASQDRSNLVQASQVKETRMTNCIISYDQKERQRAYQDCERIVR